ncbi:MAG: hypothetical protein JO144_13785, partial [Actinobacteria bacterium]|nr:hypothetical protein [Actinomycetota bacterium]
VAEPAFLLTAAGQLWQSGVALDWAAMHEGEIRRRCTTLPTYPFQRTRFRLDSGENGVPVTGHAEPAVEETPALTVRWETPTEAAVAAAFTAILGAEPRQPDVDFFSLGGDSMLASRVAARLRRELDIQIGVRAVFGHPTVGGLAAFLDGKLAGA